MKALLPVFALLAASAMPLAAGTIDWPKETFLVEKLKEATELAAKEKKAVAYIIMNHGADVDKKERRRNKDDEGQGGANQANTMTEDLAKDCAKFAVVVNVQPNDLQKQPTPFTEKVYNAMGGALNAGLIPAIVIADAAGEMIFAYAGADEIQDDARGLLRDAKRNIKEGKEAEFKKPKKDDKKDNE